MRDQSSVRFEWLAEGITMQELEAALRLCDNRTPGDGGIKFSLLKELPLEEKQFLLYMMSSRLARFQIVGTL
jgi:hypothetical protein